MSDIFKLFGTIREKLRISDLKEEQQPGNNSFIAVDVALSASQFITKKVKLQNLIAGSSATGSDLNHVELVFPSYLIPNTIFGLYSPDTIANMTKVTATLVEPSVGAPLEFEIVNADTGASLMGNNAAFEIPDGGRNLVKPLFEKIFIDPSQNINYAIKILNTGTADPGSSLSVRFTLE